MRTTAVARWLQGGFIALVVVAAGVSCDDGEQGPRVAASPPDAIANVYPPDGFVGASPSHISVGLDLLRDGGVDLGSVRLTLDGRDITDRTRRAGTEDTPQSRAELIYELSPGLSEGVHRMGVEYLGGGRSYRYAWEITVQG